MTSVVVKKAFEEGAAALPGVHKEAHANGQLTELRERAINEIFGGDAFTFERSLAASFVAQRRRFNRYKSKTTALVVLLWEWFSEFTRDPMAFIAKLTSCVTAFVESLPSESAEAEFS